MFRLVDVTSIRARMADDAALRVSLRISRFETAYSLSGNRYLKEDELGECGRVVREPALAVARGGD